MIGNNIDKEKYPDLYRITQEVIESRVQWLQESLVCQILCTQLPEEIKAMKIYSANFNESSGLSLSIHGKDDIIQSLKLLGIQELKTQISSFSKDTFYATGKGVLPDGTNLSIYVHNVNKPEGCKIEEKTFTRSEFVLVCEKTGEPI
jgi:hypothetical protein